MCCNLVVDIGNSRVKAAIMSQGEVEREWNIPSFEELPLEHITAEYAPLRSIVASTRGDGEAVCDALRSAIGQSLHLCAGVPTPLVVDYSTPHTLGVDRVVAAVGLMEQTKGHNALIIDCGTAITVDFVDSDGLFKGGFISPGLSLRYLSLNSYTSALPLCSPPSTLSDGVAPRSTNEAIEQGVLASVLYELEGHIGHFEKKYENLLLFFLGGEAFNFENRIKNAIFAGREVTFRGLDKILEYNAGNKSY